jgi:hypothetical protein
MMVILSALFGAAPDIVSWTLILYPLKSIPLDKREISKYVSGTMS